jgi:hypothetical protein
MQKRVKGKKKAKEWWRMKDANLSRVHDPEFLPVDHAKSMLFCTMFVVSFEIFYNVNSVY